MYVRLKFDVTKKHFEKLEIMEMKNTPQKNAFSGGCFSFPLFQVFQNGQKKLRKNFV
jgi:hypothetical protein